MVRKSLGLSSRCRPFARVVQVSLEHAPYHQIELVSHTRDCLSVDLDHSGLINSSAFRLEARPACAITIEAKTCRCIVDCAVFFLTPFFVYWLLGISLSWSFVTTILRRRSASRTSSVFHGTKLHFPKELSKCEIFANFTT